MSNQGSNLKECKDCAAHGVTTMVLWMQNPANPSRRMPADYDTLLKTGQYVAHKCPYWKKPGTGTAPATVAPATVSQAYASGPSKPQQQQQPQVPAPLGQSTLPLPTGNEIKLDVNTASILTNLVLALQDVADKLGTTNEYLQILANREVKANPGIKSALQVKGQSNENDTKIKRVLEQADRITPNVNIRTNDFDPQYCDHDQMGTISEDTGVCGNCGTMFPAFMKQKEQEQEQDEFPDENELEEVPQTRQQRDPDAFPPL